MKIQYTYWAPIQATMATLNQANEIIEDYQARGFGLTLRQLYYQLVARDLLPNKQEAYDRLGRIITKAREAGLVDWAAIEDRTRQRRGLRTWEDPDHVINEAIRNYRIDKWDNQRFRVFVWVEKEALAGVIQKACSRNDVQVDYLSCRGYMSASTIWEEARTIKRYADVLDQTPVILHLADHDPSGIDMTRDNIDRLSLYSELIAGSEFIYKRIALNKNQVEQYSPPPNPAKISDSRAAEYIRNHGSNSWELDALDPDVLIELIQKEISSFRDDDDWALAVKREAEDKTELRSMLNR